MQDALRRLERLLGDGTPDWHDAERSLPETGMAGPAAFRQPRAAIAGTLLAGLELARSGTPAIREDDRPFGPVLLRHRQDLPATEAGAARAAAR